MDSHREIIDNLGVKARAISGAPACYRLCAPSCAVHVWMRDCSCLPGGALAPAPMLVPCLYFSLCLSLCSGSCLCLLQRLCPTQRLCSAPDPALVPDLALVLSAVAPFASEIGKIAARSACVYPTTLQFHARSIQHMDNFVS